MLKMEIFCLGTTNGDKRLGMIIIFLYFNMKNIFNGKTENFNLFIHKQLQLQYVHLTLQRNYIIYISKKKFILPTVID
jgi:hypothetical protein